MSYYNIKKATYEKWLSEIQKDRLQEYPTMVHFYRGGLYGIQAGSLLGLFEIRGNSNTKRVSWRGKDFIVRIGHIKTPSKDPMDSILIYFLAIGADEPIPHKDLHDFITSHEKKIGIRPVMEKKGKKIK